MTRKAGNSSHCSHHGGFIQNAKSWQSMDAQWQIVQMNARQYELQHERETSWLRPAFPQWFHDSGEQQKGRCSIRCLNLLSPQVMSLCHTHAWKHTSSLVWSIVLNWRQSEISQQTSTKQPGKCMKISMWTLYSLCHLSTPSHTQLPICFVSNKLTHQTLDVYGKVRFFWANLKMAPKLLDPGKENIFDHFGVHQWLTLFKGQRQHSITYHVYRKCKNPL